MSLFSRLTVVGCLVLLVFGKPLLAREGEHHEESGEPSAHQHMAGEGGDDEEHRKRSHEHADGEEGGEKESLNHEHEADDHLKKNDGEQKHEEQGEQQEHEKKEDDKHETFEPAWAEQEHDEQKKNENDAHKEATHEQADSSGMTKAEDKHTKDAAHDASVDNADNKEATASAAQQESDKAEEQGDGDEEDNDWRSDLDTLHFKSGGNWLLKRMWWEKTEVLYEKVKQKMAILTDMRTPFFRRQADLDQKLSQFFVTAGLDRGTLLEIAHVLLDQLEDETKREDLDEQEREFHKTLLDKKRQIDQLAKDIDTLQDLEQAVDDAMTALLQQIDRAQGYEAQVWKNFKQIARELSDKEAETLYTHCEALLKNIENIISYVQGAFSQHFSGMESKINGQISTLTSTLTTLKTAGVDLQHEWRTLRHADEERMQEVVQHEQGLQEQKIKQLEKEVVDETLSGRVKRAAAWSHEKISGAAQAVVSAAHRVVQLLVVAPYTWIKGLFGSKPAGATKVSASNTHKSEEQATGPARVTPPEAAAAHKPATSVA